MTALLQTQGLTAFYGDAQALFGIDFQVGFVSVGKTWTTPLLIFSFSLFLLYAFLSFIFLRNKWQKGQVLRLVIGDDIDLGNYSLVILTDALGEFPKDAPSGVPYSSVVAGFLNIQFSGSGYKPIFDIVCIDAKNLIFEVDQIK